MRCVIPQLFDNSIVRDLEPAQRPKRMSLGSHEKSTFGSPYRR